MSGLRRSDYNTFVAVQLGRQLTKEERTILDHYRLHEGVNWKEAAKRLTRRDLALAMDVDDEADDGEPDFTREEDPVDPTHEGWRA